MRPIVILLAGVTTAAGVAYFVLRGASPAAHGSAVSISAAIPPAAIVTEGSAGKPNPASFQPDHVVQTVGTPPMQAAQASGKMPPNNTIASQASPTVPVRTESSEVPLKSTPRSRLSGSAQALADRFAEFEQLSPDQKARLQAYLSAPNPDRGLTDDTNKATTEAERFAAMHAHLDPRKAQLIEALGEDVARDYQNYIVSETIRPLTDDTAQRCATVGLSLPPDTAEKLAFALASSMEAKAAGITTAVRARTPLSEEMCASLLDNRGPIMTIAHQFLTPEQTHIFQDSLSARLNRK